MRVETLGHNATFIVPLRALTCELATKKLTATHQICVIQRVQRLALRRFADGSQFFEYLSHNG
jgi:hypothetical protein